jgi:hypothetical protein
MLAKCDTSAHARPKLLDGDADLVGGTAWFWTRADVAQAVDVLVADEAGQFSLANAVAVARGAARRTGAHAGAATAGEHAVPAGGVGDCRRVGPTACADGYGRVV